MARVTTVPATGQYNFGDGVYTFAAADAGESVTLTYSYVPFDLEQACIEIASKQYLDRSRQGKTSESHSGQNVSYDKAALSERQKASLSNYRRLVPI
jgi:hypothetical protein